MLVNCKACGKEIGKGVKKCVNCGSDQRNCFSRHKILTGILVLVIIGIGSAMGSGGESNAATAPTSSATAATQQPKAAPMVVTVDKLMEDLMKGNSLNASDTYKGKYVEVTGQLSIIDSSGKYFLIAPMDDSFSLAGSFSLNTILCNITPEQKVTVSKFTSEQKVTVTGTMTDVGEIRGYTMKVESIK